MAWRLHLPQISSGRSDVTWPGTAVVAAVAVDGGAAGAGLLYMGVGAAVLVA
jgi:hypothetical protein